MEEQSGFDVSIYYSTLRNVIETRIMLPLTCKELEDAYKSNKDNFQTDLNNSGEEISVMIFNLYIDQGFMPLGSEVKFVSNDSETIIKKNDDGDWVIY